MLGEDCAELRNGDDKNKNGAESITIVNVLIEDFLLIRDALFQAVGEFNRKTQKFKLSTEVDKYALRISKKSGKPNYDLPQLNMKNYLKDSKIDQISVVLGEKHIIRNFIESDLRTDSSLIGSSYNNNMIINSTLNRSKSKTESEKREDNLLLKEKKKCCSLCLIF